MISNSLVQNINLHISKAMHLFLQTIVIGVPLKDFIYLFINDRILIFIKLFLQHDRAHIKSIHSQQVQASNHTHISTSHSRKTNLKHH